MSIASAALVDQLAKEAGQLAAQGLYRQALDLLSGQPSEALDAQTLADTVLWRRAAFDPEQGSPDWPRTYSDPFPDAPSPPEIPVRDLTVEILGGAIQHHGALIVRGLTDQDQTRELVDVVRKAFATADAAKAGVLQPGASAWYSPYPLGPDDGMTASARWFGASSGAIWTGDSPRAFFDFVAFLKAHGVINVVEGYLGERPYLSLGKSTLRVVEPGANTGWHQDGSFLGHDIRTVNVWLALSDCGIDAPGLDVVPRRLNELAESGTRDAFDWWVVADGVVEDMSKEIPVVSPVFRAGDAMLFDQLFLHRTGVRPWMTKERLAIESWFFAGSTFPMQQMPLAL